MPPGSGEEDTHTDPGELESSKETGVEDSEDNGAANPHKGGTMRKSLFSRLSSRQTIGEPLRVPGKGKERSQSISDKASDWKTKLSKRIAGVHGGAAASASMPSEEEVLAQFEAYVVSRGLEDQRAQLDVMSTEAKVSARLCLVVLS